MRQHRTPKIKMLGMQIALKFFPEQGTFTKNKK